MHWSYCVLFSPKICIPFDSCPSSLDSWPKGRIFWFLCGPALGTFSIVFLGEGGAPQRKRPLAHHKYKKSYSTMTISELLAPLPLLATYTFQRQSYRHSNDGTTLIGIPPPHLPLPSRLNATISHISLLKREVAVPSPPTSSLLKIPPNHLSISFAAGLFKS